MLWRSWTPDTQGTTGSVTSSPFRAPRYVAVPHLGFPGEVPGNRIFFRCLDTGLEMDIATLRTNTVWATAFVQIPDRFCAGSTVLVATAVHPTFYVGVGTPFATSAPIYRAYTGFPARAIVVILTWAVLACLIFCAALLYKGSADDALPAGFVLLGAVAVLVLVVFHFSPALGRWAVWLLVSIAAAVTVAVRITRRERFDAVASQIANPIVLWLAVALICAAFVSSADSGGGSWAINGLFTPLRWSSDNQLPYLFAEALFDGTPREQIVWGPWLASDRTPLLAALLLIPRTTMLQWLAPAYGHTFVPIGYMMAGITVLASWAAVVAWICKQFAPAAVSIVILLAFLSPFVFFDTVYVWPKMLGATYVVFSFGLLYRMSLHAAQSRRSLTLVAACAAFAYLCHASSAFALLPVAAFFNRTILRQGWRAIAAASLIGASLLLPWAVWQNTVQPGGNALVRYAFANDEGFDTRTASIVASVAEAYRRLGFNDWLGAKSAAIRLMLGIGISATTLGQVARHSPGLDAIGIQRVLDFFVTARSLGMASAGLVLLPVFWLFGRRSPALRFAASAAAAGMGGILLMLALTLPRAVMHHQAFGSLLLLVLAGSVTVASMPRWATRTSIGLAATYFAVVWVIHPLAVAERLVWSGIAACAFSAILLGLAILRVHSDS